MPAPRPVRFVPSLDLLKAKIRRRTREMQDLTIPNRQIAAYLDRWVQTNFRQEGRPVGGWTPFKRGGRVLRGGRIDRSAKLLQHTGRLRASFERLVTKRRTGIYTDLYYAEFHEFGTVHLPVRRMLPTEREVIRPVIRIYEAYLTKLARIPL